MHQPRPELGYSEHDRPAGHVHCLLSLDGLAHLLELGQDPILVVAVAVQLPEDPERLVVPILLDQLSRALGEPEQAYGKEQSGHALERKREPPLERAGLGGMCTAVSDPRTDDKPNTDHLLRQPDDQPTHLRRRQLRLVHGHSHAHDPDSPAGDDAADQHHGEVRSRRLQDRADDADERADLDALAAAEAVDGETAAQCADAGAAGERADYGAEDRRRFVRVEVVEEVLRGDHVRHHAGVVAEQE